MGPIPQRMGIPHRGGPIGRWDLPGREQEISDGRSLEWGLNDRPHSILISAYAGPRPRRTGGQ